MDQLKCTQCGALIQGGGRFCPKCGCAVPEIQTTVSQPANMNQTVNINQSANMGQSANMNQTKSENKGKKMAITIAVSVLLCLIIIMTGAAASAIFIIRSGFSQASVESAVRKVEFTKLKVGSLVKSGDKKAKLPDMIYDSISPEFRDKMGDRETAVEAIEDIMEEDFIRDFVSEKTGDYMSDILTGSGKGKIEVEEVLDLLKDNQDELEEIIDIPFSEKDFDEVEKFLKRNDILDAIQLSEIKEDNRSAFDTVKNLCSYILFAILLCVSVVVMIGLFFVNRAFRRTMIYVGASLLAIGVLDCVIGMMTDRAAAVMNDILALGEDVYMTLLTPARTCSFILGGCMILAGVLAAVLPQVLRKRQKAV